MGTVVGPVGTVVGAVVGAVAGGLVGKGVAEGINPTVEHSYWQKNYATRPYVTAGTSYDQYGPAYQHGWESRTRHMDRGYTEVESDIGSTWEHAKGKSSLTWEQAKHAVRDGWDHVTK